MRGARFNSYYAKLIAIQVYDPTNDADDESEEEYYKQLQREIEAAPRRDVLIVLGDLNGNIGEYNEGWEKVMGRHGLERMNENGERLEAFLYISQNFIMARFAVFEQIKLHQIFKAASISP